MSFQRITANFVGNTRYDTIGDKQYLVAPMVMLTEGVHAGSEGPLFYPSDELSKTPQVWNHKPVVVYHPSAPDGSALSACNSDILSRRGVGLIMNTRFEDGKLKAEAWLDESRANKIDERIAQAIEKNQVMELSTGLFTDNVAESGEWNGEKYDRVARNFRPDHLALLPDLKGACSIEDGAGFLRLNAVPGQIKIINNEMSFDNIRSMLNSWLQEKNKDLDVWVRDVYSDFFVFTKNAKLFKGDYTVKDNAVTVTGLFDEVVQVTEYRTPDGTFVGNENDVANRKEAQMNKEKMVSDIITSNLNSWVETDRDTLMKLDDASLEKMVSSEALAAKTAVENAAKKVADELAVNEAKKAADKIAADKLVANTHTAPKTVDEYVNDKSMPEAVRNVLKSGLATYNAQKAAYITHITANERNQFTKEQLELKDNTELAMIANLMEPLADEAVNDFSVLGVATQTTETPMLMQAVIGPDKK